MKMYSQAVLLLSLIAATAAFESDATSFSITAACDGAQDVPPVDTPATATFSATATRPSATPGSDWTLDYAVSIEDLSAGIAAAHIHAGAEGTNGGVIINFNAFGLGGATSGAATGSVVISEAVAMALTSSPSSTYVNIHTTAFPSGEIRGQVVFEAAPIEEVTGDCILTTFANIKESQKTCYSCQWQCLTDKQCTDMSFNGVSFTKTELTSVDCGEVDGNAYFTDPTRSDGLCVLLDENANVTDFPAFVFDTQEQGCVDCAHQCFYDQRCTGIIFNYVSAPKAALADPSAYCAQ